MFAPYTDDEELNIKWAFTARAHSKTFKVPVEFTSWVAIGFFNDLGTDPRAARCTTTSEPEITLLIKSLSRIEDSINSTPVGILTNNPVDKSSTIITSCPLDTKFLVKLVPTNPAPPVITIFIKPPHPRLS